MLAKTKEIISNSFGSKEDAPPLGQTADVMENLEGHDRAILRESLTFFTLAAKFRFMMECPDSQKLFEKICSDVNLYEDRLLNSGVADDVVKKASLCICSMLDEHVFMTPWGARSNWVHVGLSQRIHGNIDGGSAFFEDLDHIQSKGVLAIMFLTISTGFMGKYREATNGEVLVREFKSAVYDKLSRPNYRFANVVKRLVPKIYWKDNVTFSRSLMLVCALIGVALFATYTYHQYQLNRMSDTPVARIDNATQSYIASLTERQNTKAQHSESLLSYMQRRLAGPLRQNLLGIKGEDGRVILTVKGGAFRSGSASIKKSYGTAIKDIAKALANVTGRLDINGHSDNQRISSARFPSNWHLSKARAKAIERAVLGKASTQDSGAISHAIAGMGAKQPLVPNDSAKNRQINRRVELVIVGKYLGH